MQVLHLNRLLQEIDRQKHSIKAMNWHKYRRAHITNTIEKTTNRQATSGIHGQLREKLVNKRRHVLIQK